MAAADKRLRVTGDRREAAGRVAEPIEDAAGRVLEWAYSIRTRTDVKGLDRVYVDLCKSFHNNDLSATRLSTMRRITCIGGADSLVSGLTRSPDIWAPSYSGGGWGDGRER